MICAGSAVARIERAMRPSFLDRSSDRVARSRCGLTQIELALALVVLFLAAAVSLPQLPPARTNGTGNTCRSNMRAVATAIFQYGNDNGKYPGYMNVLQ